MRLAVNPEFSRLDTKISDKFFGKRGKQFPVKEIENIVNEMMKEASVEDKPWSPGDDVVTEGDFLVTCCSEVVKKDPAVIDMILEFHKLYIEYMTRNLSTREKALLGNRWWDLVEKFLRRQQAAVRDLAKSLEVDVDLKAVFPPLRFVHGRGVPQPRPKKQHADGDKGAAAQALLEMKGAPAPAVRAPEEGEEEVRRCYRHFVGALKLACSLLMAPVLGWQWACCSICGSGLSPPGFQVPSPTSVELPSQSCCIACSPSRS